MNELATRVEAFIDNQSTVEAAGGDVIVTANDVSAVNSDVLAASVSIAAGAGRWDIGRAGSESGL